MLYRVCYYYYSDIRKEKVCKVIRKGMTIDQAIEFKNECLKKIPLAKGTAFEYPADLKVIIQYDSWIERRRLEGRIIGYIMARYAERHQLETED